MSYDIRIWEVWTAGKITKDPVRTWSWWVVEESEKVAEGGGVITEEYARKAAEQAASLHWHQQRMESFTYEFDPKPVSK